MKKSLNNLTGYLSEGNINTLQKYVKLATDYFPSVVIVDIGTCAGKSAISMAIVNKKKVQVLTVDPSPHASFQDNVDSMGVGDTIYQFEESSVDFGKHNCPKIQICFIDGIHSYQGVKDDIEGIAKKVVSGGWVMFHDANLYDGVRKAIEEYEGKYYQFIEEVGGRTEAPKEGSVYVARRI